MASDGTEMSILGVCYGGALDGFGAAVEKGVEASVVFQAGSQSRKQGEERVVIPVQKASFYSSVSQHILYNLPLASCFHIPPSPFRPPVN